ncbi:unnamed protein product [Fusarium graminearum]|nr:unnamed protein product [Fusarium graminearum]CAG1974744.1 unnamed protein product [Fusarium graminearum]
MPRGPYDTTGVVKPGAPKPPKGKKCPQLVPTSVMSQRASGQFSLLLETFPFRLLTPPQGHTVIPSQHACFSDMRTVFAMMISTADRNKKGFVG